MRKYWAIFTTDLQNNLAYRTNFLIWRLRQLFTFLVPIFVWQFIFSQQNSIYNYSLADLMTYVFLSLILRSLIFGSSSYELAAIINNGDLSLYLLKPFNIFKYYLARDLSDKLINLSFIIFELPLLYLIFHPPLLIQTNPLILIQFVIYLVVALLLYFYLSFIFGSLGFWTREVWAPRFLLMVILEFAVGGIFPLDMLPPGFHVFLRLSPFSHMLFLPLKTYLGAAGKFLPNLSLALAWLAVFYFVAHLLWKKGLRHYEAEGR